MNKIEIWSKERWEANNTFDDMDAAAEKMSELGLSF
jgi:MraZ protein